MERKHSQNKSQEKPKPLAQNEKDDLDLVKSLLGKRKEARLKASAGVGRVASEEPEIMDSSEGLEEWQTRP